MFGVNSAVALLLAGSLLVLVNVLGQRFHRRWNVGDTDFARLSPKTGKLLSSISGPVRVYAFLQPDREMYPDIKALLEAYADAARSLPDLDFKLEMVDPNRDLARTRDLRNALGVAEPNVIVFEYAGRRKYVEESEVVDYRQDVDYEKLLAGEPAVRRRRVAFRGEQAFSSAIQSVVHEASPSVFMTTGHGERRADDFGENAGYSEIARAIRRDNMALDTIGPDGLRAVPDGAALLIAGPTRAFSETESSMIRSYLDRGGRLFLLLDPGVASGLEPLLAAWGVTPGRGRVVGPSLTGRDLLVNARPGHEITRPLRDVALMFYGPGPLEIENGESGAVDRPRAAILACNSAGDWVETAPSQDPPRFDPEADRRGPAAVAVAVERGSPSDMSLGIKPTRIVAVSGSDFVSNGALRIGVSGNRDFFMSAMNWLLEREELMDIAPRPPGELRPDMSRRQVVRTYLAVMLLAPAAIALAGLAVARRRR